MAKTNLQKIIEKREKRKKEKEKKEKNLEALRKFNLMVSKERRKRF